MGNWNINIQGLGCHHNSATDPADANNMAAKFVKDLQDAGHQVQSATFTSGSAEDVRLEDPKNPPFPLQKSSKTALPAKA